MVLLKAVVFGKLPKLLPFNFLEGGRVAAVATINLWPLITTQKLNEFY